MGGDNGGCSGEGNTGLGGREGGYHGGGEGIGG